MSDRVFENCRRATRLRRLALETASPERLPCSPSVDFGVGEDGHRIQALRIAGPAVAPRPTPSRARKLIELAAPAQPLRPTTKDQAPAGTDATDKPVHPCPRCGARMVIIEMFEAGTTPRHRPSVMPIAIRIDTS